MLRKNILILLITLCLSSSIYSEVKMTLYPFKNISWTDNILTVINKIRPKAKKTKFFQLYLHNTKGTWNLKKLKNEDDIIKAIIKSSYDNIKNKKSGYKLLNIIGKEKKNYPVIQISGITISIMPYKFLGVKTVINLNFHYHSRIPLLNPESMVTLLNKGETQLYLPLYLNSIEIKSNSKKFSAKTKKFIKKKYMDLFEYTKKIVAKMKKKNNLYGGKMPTLKMPYLDWNLYDSDDNKMDIDIWPKTKFINKCGGHIIYEGVKYKKELDNAR